MENKKPEVKKVEIEVAGEIELPELDVTKYEGQKVPIASVDVMEGSYGYFVQVKTGVVDTIERSGDQENIVIAGSRQFGLQTDANGKVGWGKTTQLGKFMNKMKCASLNDLIGRDVVLIAQYNEKADKTFLTFA